MFLRNLLCLAVLFCVPQAAQAATSGGHLYLVSYPSEMLDDATFGISIQTDYVSQYRVGVDKYKEKTSHFDYFTNLNGNAICRLKSDKGFLAKFEASDQWLHQVVDSHTLPSNLHRSAVVTKLAYFNGATGTGTTTEQQLTEKIKKQEDEIKELKEKIVQKDKAKKALEVVIKGLSDELDSLKEWKNYKTAEHAVKKALEDCKIKIEEEKTKAADLVDKDLALTALNAPLNRLKEDHQIARNELNEILLKPDDYSHKQLTDALKKESEIKNALDKKEEQKNTAVRARDAAKSALEGAVKARQQCYQALTKKIEKRDELQKRVGGL